LLIRLNEMVVLTGLLVLAFWRERGMVFVEACWASKSKCCSQDVLDENEEQRA